MNTTTASDNLVALLVENHTRQKLFYLKRYIDEFATATKDKWPIRNFIDLFAGPGLNVVEGSAQEIDGSPMLAIKTRYPFTGYYVCDAERSFLDTLSMRREEAIRAGLAQKSHFSPYPGDANEETDRILSEIHPTRSINLVVVDPPGAHCHWATIEKLSQLSRVDFVINFPLGMAIKRIIRQSFEAEEDTSLDRFFGTTEWRTIFEQTGQQPHLAARRLIDLFKRNLAELGYLEDKQIGEITNYSSSVEIRRDEGQRLYLLILASRHPLAHHLWSQAIKVDDEGQPRLPGM